MAKDYWLIERKFKDGDKYFISEVNYSDKKLVSERGSRFYRLLQKWNFPRRYRKFLGSYIGTY